MWCHGRVCLARSFVAMALGADTVHIDLRSLEIDRSDDKQSAPVANDLQREIDFVEAYGVDMTYEHKGP